MKTKLSKSRALSTVLTTVIILVASVVLGSGVVLYGASLFQGGTQTESISVSGVKVWVHGTEDTGLAWGAAKIRNTGDKVVSIDKIQIRGADVPFLQWYTDTVVSGTLFQQALKKREFMVTYRVVAREFKERFTTLFGGGTAQLQLTDPEDPMGSGIDIIARPPGKRVQSLPLLSGGERSLTAAALILAVPLVGGS